MINQECQLQELLIAYDRTGPAYYNITSQYLIRSKTFEMKTSAIKNSSFIELDLASIWFSLCRDCTHTWEAIVMLALPCHTNLTRNLTIICAFVFLFCNLIHYSC